MIQDLRYGARSLARSPGLTAAAVLSLALGIGANTALFSCLHAALMSDIPGVSEPERLAGVVEVMEKTGRPSANSYPDYADLRDAATSFSGLAAYGSRRRWVLSDDAAGVRVPGEFVTGNYFQVLGVRAARGRLLAPGDEAACVISHGLWKRRYGADPNIIGRTVRLNRRELAIVGVASEEFRGVRIDAPADVWATTSMLDIEPGLAASVRQRGTRWMQMIGRLAPGVSLARANAEVRTIARRMAAAHPDPYGARSAIAVESYKQRVPFGARGFTAAYLGFLLGFAGMVLLIACANVANLLLARGTARRKELGLRLALGADRARLVRQLLTESLLLAAASGAAGIGVARLASGLVGSFALGFSGATLEPRLDLTALAFALALSVITGLAFGVAPALTASRLDPARAINESGAAATPRRGARLRSAFAITQVALSVVLLVVAGLFQNAFRAAFRSMAAHEPDTLVLVALDARRAGSPAVALREAAARLAAVPGVERAALAETFPGDVSETTAIVESAPHDPMQIGYNVVEPGYFRVLNAPLVRGRDFTSADRDAAVVNEALARRAGLGAGLRVGKNQPFTEVIGIVRDGAADPRAYIPLARRPAAQVMLSARVPSVQAAVAGIRQELKRLPPDVAAGEVQTLSALVSDLLKQERMAAALTGTFAVLALALAALGIYSLLAYVAGQRTREMGIRLALGATRGGLLALLLGRGARLALAGIAIGAALAFAVARALAAFVHGVSAPDPATFAAVAAVLLAVGLGATAAPAWRASRVDPIQTLRT